MTPAVRQAMIEAWKVIHKGVRPDHFPSVTHTAEKMFAAGLAHSREQAAALLDEFAAKVDAIEDGIGDLPNDMREQAAKIRSGE